jgi:hypothetical protein
MAWKENSKTALFAKYSNGAAPGRLFFRFTFACCTLQRMKLRPFRAKHVGKQILRDRMIAEVAKSPGGQRVIRECQAALNLPVNSDELSRRLVLDRFATEVDLYPYELEGLLARKPVASRKESQK